MTDERPGDIHGLLSGLRSERCEEAWGTFVSTYGPALLQVVHLFEKDADSVRNCFVFICEQLAADRFRRLMKYQPREGASFVTWLRAVARNLCIDWKRRNSGRKRPATSIRRLTVIEQEIYRLCFLDGLGPREALQCLENSYPGLTEAEISATIEKIYSILTPRQRWLLCSRSPRLETLSLQDDGTFASLKELLSPGSNPEELLREKEQRIRLVESFRLLSESERKLLRLRYVEERSLKACADLLGLGSPQRADRLITGALARLRSLISL